MTCKNLAALISPAAKEPPHGPASFSYFASFVTASESIYIKEITDMTTDLLFHARIQHILETAVSGLSDADRDERIEHCQRTGEQ